jgi:protein ImuB
LLPAERLIRVHGCKASEPFALVEKQHGAVRLVACDAAALAVGIRPGLTLADARARVPELAAFDYDSAADRELLAWLADGCERYTPAIMIDPPQGLLLDLAGCTHLFGEDETRLARDLMVRLRHHGFTARFAFGATPDSARAKARYAAKSVQALPVEALDCDAMVHSALRRAGLKTIGQLATRPRSPLAARFGKLCIVKLARLLEEEDPHIVPRRALPTIQVEQNFAEPIGRTADILATIEALAGKAAKDLCERGQGGRQFELSLFRSDGHVARLAVETGGPTRDAMLLMRLIRERIEALADPLDPGFGYDLIRLSIPITERLQESQIGLEAQVDPLIESAALIDRLSARLGSERIRRFQKGDSHIAERNAFEVPALVHRPPDQWPKPQPGEPAMRPVRLFEIPQPVEVIAAVPDGPPRQFRWRRKLHHVVSVEGPERIAAEWWRRKAGHEMGKAGLTRDYYRVEDSEGCRFWLFRHGLYSEKSDPVWYLHGLFA